KLHTHVRYKMGTNPFTGEIHEGKTLAGQEKIVRKGNHVYIYGTMVRSHINPERVTVNKGDTVTFYLTNLERAEDETHGFTVDHYNVHASLEPGKTVALTFKADLEGVFPYYCTEFCSALHLEMMGYLMVKDPNKKYTAAKKLKMAAMSPEQLKKEYDQTVAVNDATDKVIQSVVKFLKDNHYEKYPTIKALVEDALDQYGKIAEQKKKADEALKAGDVEKAILFENMIWQYMVKTADVGIRAKDLLVKKVAKPMSEAAARGEEAFNEGGCGGCHVIGKVSSGPDLTGVLQRHENGEKWVTDFIMDPKTKFKDPYVESMINYFNLRMPNQGMKEEQVKDIVEYLKWIDENSNLF
ncbi:MAG: cytochrome C, partial [Epsilonproteobacteria bacterium 4484_20]